MNKKLNLLYFSPTDTTAKIIKGVASGIGEAAKEYNLTLPVNRQDEIAFTSNDLVIVGVPVYAGRVPDVLVDFFAKVKGNNTQAIFIVVYGNRHYDDALLELKDIFEAQGFIAVAAAAFIGEHSYTSQVGAGRPDTDDVKNAKNFGLHIKSKLSNEDDEVSKLIVKGQYPYKEKVVRPVMLPITNDNCIKCSICAKLCPTGAIDFSNYNDVNAVKCIKCCSCIRRCPVGAKSMKHEMFHKIKQSLIENCSTVRREPEIFI